MSTVHHVLRLLLNEAMASTRTRGEKQCEWHWDDGRQCWCLPVQLGDVPETARRYARRTLEDVRSVLETVVGLPAGVSLSLQLYTPPHRYEHVMSEREEIEEGDPLFVLETRILRDGRGRPRRFDAHDFPPGSFEMYSLWLLGGL